MACPTVADDILKDPWTVTGFGTLGYAQTDKYAERLFRRSVYQDANKVQEAPYKLDSRIGLQFKSHVTNHWEIVLQGVLRHQYATNLDDYIDVAFARYSASNQWQFTLGRQPFDLFLLSDHRNVGYAYDWVRPPTEFYGYLPFDSFDGLKINHQWGDFDREWSWNLSIGFIEEQFESGTRGNEEQSANARPDTAKANPIYNTEFTYRSNDWHLRASFAWLEFEQRIDGLSDVDEFAKQLSPVWPGLNDILDAFTFSNNVLRYYSAGASWEKNGWKVQSEISHINADFVTYNGERAYLSLHKRLGEWAPFVLLGYAHDDNEYDFQGVDESSLPPDSTLLPLLLDAEQQVASSVTAIRHNQKSLGLGVRWDFATKKAVKLQCERYWFESGSGSIHSRVDNNYQSDETRHWCSFTFDWVF